MIEEKTEKTSIQASAVKFMNWPLTSNNDPRVKQGSSDSQIRNPSDGGIQVPGEDKEQRQKLGIRTSWVIPYIEETASSKEWHFLYKWRSKETKNSHSAILPNESKFI